MHLLTRQESRKQLSDPQTQPRTGQRVSWSRSRPSRRFSFSGRRDRGDKKAEGHYLLNQTFYLLLGAVLIVFLVPHVLQAMSAGSSSEQQAATNNFEGLARNIDALLGSTRQYEETTTTLSLPPGYAIVGFDRGWDSLQVHGQALVQEGDTDGPIIRPLRCGDQACLCLYQGDIKENSLSEQDTNILDCRTFSSEVIFISHYRSKEEPRFCGIHRQVDVKSGNAVLDKAPYGYFVIYGDECGTWNSQRLYLDKMDMRYADPDQQGLVYLYGAIQDEASKDFLGARKKEIDTLSSIPLAGNVILGSGSSKTMDQAISAYLPTILDAMHTQAPSYEGITPSLILGHILTESAGRTDAVSSADAAGLMQFTYATAKENSQENGVIGGFRESFLTACSCLKPASRVAGTCISPRCGPANDDRFNPDRAIRSGINYLNKLATQYLAAYHTSPDYLSFVIAAYNAGPGAVIKAIRKTGKANPSFAEVSAYLPAETAQYVPRVLAYKELAEQKIGTTIT
ncbi:MAG: lytic transglycosylase domain-containing protein [DPANN group archaeon]|nr:lytic transglycosylase domain-containing protein [DPANN group archaeon]